MADDKLAGHLALVSPTLAGALDLLVEHAPKARTLALRYEDRPEAFEGLIAVEGGQAFLPDGSPNPDYQRKLDAFLGHAPPQGCSGPNTAGGQPLTLSPTGGEAVPRSNAPWNVSGAYPELEKATVRTCSQGTATRAPPIPTLDYVRSGLVIAADGTSIDLGDGTLMLRGCHVATVRDRTVIIEPDPPLHFTAFSICKPPRACCAIGSGGNAHDRRVRRRRLARNKVVADATVATCLAVVGEVSGD